MNLKNCCLYNIPCVPAFLCALCVHIFLCVLCDSVFPDLLWPLKEKTYITGTFGEFRRNHIHAGVDISTLGKTGLPVYAGDDGTLYRLKTQFLGYGKAVYIKLNNGNILLYAHLDRFSPEINNLVIQEQEKASQYEIDYIAKEDIPIRRGQIIGYTGDTGGSAPHLHIEMRDKNDHPINILQKGLFYEDKTPPVIGGLAVCDPFNTYCISYYPSEKIPKEISVSEGACLAISAYDLSNGNKIGVHEIELEIDGKLFFSVEMDVFSYDNYNDNFIPYNRDIYISKDKIFYNLFKAFNNKLPFYPQDKDGILRLPNGRHTAKITVKDNAGNASSLNFTIIPKSFELPSHVADFIEKWLSKDNLFSLLIQKKNLYYPTKVDIRLSPSVKAGELIPASQIYDLFPKAAVFSKAEIEIKNMSNTARTGLYKYETGKWKYMEDNLIRVFSKYALFQDTTPPSIQIASLYPLFRVKIDDKGSGLNYEKLSLFIDKKKVIAEYSVTRKELFYRLQSKGHKILCEASDKAGNTNKKEIQI